MMKEGKRLTRRQSIACHPGEKSAKREDAAQIGKENKLLRADSMGILKMKLQKYAEQKARR